MADYLDEDDDLLSGDYRKKDDILDEDLDENELLYGSEEEEESAFVANSPDPPVCEIKQVSYNQSESQEIDNKNIPVPVEETRSDLDPVFQEKNKNETLSEVVSENNAVDNDLEDEIPVKRVKKSISSTEAEVESETNLLHDNDDDQIDASVLDGDEQYDDLEESDEDEDDRGGRFKSERTSKSNLPTTRNQPSDKREIPDTLELSEEAQKQLEDFDKEEMERRSRRGRGRGGQRGRGQGMKNRGQQQNRQNFMNGNRRNFQRGGIQQFSSFSRPMIRPNMNRPVLIQGRPPYFGGLGILGPPPNISTQQQQQIRPNHLGPPPNLQQTVSSQNQKPYTPFQPTVSLPFPSTIPPPTLPISQIVSSMPPPVLFNTLANPLVVASNHPIGAEGAPIPTLLSTTNKRVDQGGREVVYSDRTAEDSQLSVKITSAPRSPRSLSRSPSPLGRSSHRKRSMKSKRRRRSPSSRKRSRRRSRSYSPGYRRSKASIAEQLQQDANKKIGKIHINPHFKGARSIPSSATVTPFQNPAQATKIPFPPPSFPPPSIPPSTVLIPPPPRVSTLNNQQRLISPPNVSVPPPMLPLPLNINVPPPRLVPPPSIKPQWPQVAAPRPQIPGLSSSNPFRPPVEGLVIQSGQQRFGAPQRMQMNKPREQHQRGAINANKNMPRARQPLNHGNYNNNAPRSNTKEQINQQNFSRIKPPPSANVQQTPKSQIWKETTEDANYQELLRQQSEQRKLVFANKTRRNNNNNKGQVSIQQSNKQGNSEANEKLPVLKGEVNQTITGQVKELSVTVSNVSTSTKPEIIKNLMLNIGPVENFEFDPARKIFVGSFGNVQHAKQFSERYNREDTKTNATLVLK